MLGFGNITIGKLRAQYLFRSSPLTHDSIKNYSTKIKLYTVHTATTEQMPTTTDYNAPGHL